MASYSFYVGLQDGLIRAVVMHLSTMRARGRLFVVCLVVVGAPLATATARTPSVWAEDREKESGTCFGG